MTAIKNLIARIRRLPPDMQFSEVERVLKYLGGSNAGGKGSHFIFCKSGKWQITIPKKGGQRVKRIYLRKIVELLDLEETDESQDR